MQKAVPSQIYSKEYYAAVSEGAALTKQDAILSPRLEYMMSLVKLTKKDTVLDVGCGPGQLCFAAAKRASYVVGIDYSKDAIDICNTKKKNASALIRKRTTFYETDVGHLAEFVGDKKFTAIFMTDVVEHLYPAQLKKLFRDLKKLLAPGGKLYIHTAPNLEFYRYGYPVIRFLYPVLRHVPPARTILETKENWKGLKRLPKDPEKGSHNKLGHVNEQTPTSLRKALDECGYESKIWVLPFLRAVRGMKIKIIYGVLSLPLLKKMFGADIVAIAQLRDT